MKLEHKTYHTRAEKIIDFVVGFFGWYVINLFGLFVVGIVEYELSLGPACGSILGLFSLLANVGGLIYFAFTRKWIALGVLVAFSSVFLLILCFIATCFAMLANAS